MNTIKKISANEEKMVSLIHDLQGDCLDIIKGSHLALSAILELEKRGKSTAQQQKEKHFFISHIEKALRTFNRNQETLEGLMQGESDVSN